MLAGEFGFGFAAHDADDFDAQPLGPLAQEQPDAAGSRVHQDRFALGHLIGAAQEVLRGQALEHDRCRLLVGDPLRDFDQPVGGDVSRFAVSARLRVYVGNAIAHAKSPDLLAERGDHACCFPTDATWQFDRIKTSAIVNVDVVQPDRRVTNLGFIGRGAAKLHVFITQNFRSAVLVETDGLGHGPMIPGTANSVRAVRRARYT